MSIGKDPLYETKGKDLTNAERKVAAMELDSRYKVLSTSAVEAYVYDMEDDETIYDLINRIDSDIEECEEALIHDDVNITDENHAASCLLYDESYTEEEDDEDDDENYF